MESAHVEGIVGFCKTVVPPVISFLLGVLYKESRDKRAQKIGDLKNAIREASVSAQLYWAKGGQDQETEKEIRSGLLMINAHVAEVAKKKGAKAEAAWRPFDEANSDFFELATGGDFAKKGRKADEKRAKKCGELATRMIRDLPER